MNMSRAPSPRPGISIYALRRSTINSKLIAVTFASDSSILLAAGNPDVSKIGVADDVVVDGLWRRAKPIRVKDACYESNDLFGGGPI